ncbi:MAG: type IV toxin-antitoxin system AbiEi family antitoxin [Vicinamibacterales bacterium]
MGDDIGTRRYLVQEKRHLRFQDAAVIADQMLRRRAALPPAHAADGLLLLAPHVRPQHAAILERAGIDYVDLAGNAHLQAPGLLIHVEGRRPIKEPVRGPARPHKAWVKTVMALLVQPDLVRAPYRTIAEQADVALGAVGGCMKDLVLRGELLEGKAGRELVDRTALIAVWVNAYAGALRPKLKERRFQVRAEDKEGLVAGLSDVLGKRKTPWALTGADAAARRTHFFRAEETEIYAPINVFEDRGLQRALVAQPAERGGNLLVIEPPGPLAMPLMPSDRVPVAPDLLAYAELRYRGTDQANEAADLLLPLVLNDGAR